MNQPPAGEARGSARRSGPEEPSRTSRVLFGLAALSFVGAGISHVVRGLAHDPGDTSSPGRHALFVVINALAVLGVLRRPRWFLVPFALLVVQQLGTHGVRAVSALQAGGAPRIDDVLVALGMPIVLGLLLHDAKRRASE
jgi:hypothetical protein